jgi:hypothetical protein
LDVAESVRSGVMRASNARGSALKEATRRTREGPVVSDVCQVERCLEDEKSPAIIDSRGTGVCVPP